MDSKKSGILDLYFGVVCDLKLVFSYSHSQTLAGLKCSLLYILFKDTMEEPYIFCSCGFSLFWRIFSFLYSRFGLYP